MKIMLTELTRWLEVLIKLNKVESRACGRHKLYPMRCDLHSDWTKPSGNDLYVSWGWWAPHSYITDVIPFPPTFLRNIQFIFPTLYSTEYAASVVYRISPNKRASLNKRSPGLLILIINNSVTTSSISMKLSGHLAQVL